MNKTKVNTPRQVTLQHDLDLRKTRAFSPRNKTKNNFASCQPTRQRHSPSVPEINLNLRRRNDRPQQLNAPGRRINHTV